MVTSHSAHPSVPFKQQHVCLATFVLWSSAWVAGPASLAPPGMTSMHLVCWFMRSSTLHCFDKTCSFTIWSSSLVVKCSFVEWLNLHAAGCPLCLPVSWFASWTQILSQPWSIFCAGNGMPHRKSETGTCERFFGSSMPCGWSSVWWLSFSGTASLQNLFCLHGGNSTEVGIWINWCSTAHCSYVLFGAWVHDCLKSWALVLLFL